VSVQPSYYLHTKQVLPKVGFGIYQPLFSGIAADMWAGVGMAPAANESGNEKWFSSKVDLMMPSGDFKFVVGAGYSLSDKADVHAKLTYDLW
jgi:hypothetical protein